MIDSIMSLCSICLYYCVSSWWCSRDVYRTVCCRYGFSVMFITEHCNKVMTNICVGCAVVKRWQFTKWFFPNKVVFFDYVIMYHFLNVGARVCICLLLKLSWIQEKNNDLDWGNKSAKKDDFEGSTPFITYAHIPSPCLPFYGKRVAASQEDFANILPSCSPNPKAHVCSISKVFTNGIRKTN